jgi:hypothetical protein
MYSCIFFEGKKLMMYRKLLGPMLGPPLGARLVTSPGVSNMVSKPENT